MVTDAINKMKQGKAGGPTGVAIKMIKPGGRETVTVILELVNQIIYEKNFPENWKHSFIVNCDKRKGYATDCGNYRGLKLLEQVMKILEHVLESRTQFVMNNMQFGFMPGRNTTDVIYIL